MKNNMITTFGFFRKFLVLLTLGSFLSMSVQAPAMAGMVSSDALDTASRVEQQRDHIRSLVARDDVRAFLAKEGVSSEDLNGRIDAMTDAEVLQFHQQLDNLPAGEGAFGTVIAVVVVFMLLDMAGVTDIFPGL